MPIAYPGDRHQLFCTPYSNKSRDNGAPFIYYRLSRVKCGKNAEVPSEISLQRGRAANTSEGVALNARQARPETPDL